jgi:hypothetical protein
MNSKIPVLKPHQILRIHAVVKQLQEGAKPYRVNQAFRDLVEKKSQFIPKIWGDIK